MTRLAEVADINPRLLFKPAPDTPISFLGMADVNAEFGTTSLGIERPYSEVSKGYTSFEGGDLLVAKITPCFENGKIAQASLKNRQGVGSTEFHVVRPRPNLLHPRYGLHLLRSPQVRLAGERRMTGSAGQRRVPEAFLADIEVPLLSLREQARIADILDRADALRAKRRQALVLLDELASSIFLDMFGDPAVSRTTLPVRTIGDILEGAQYGTSAKAGATGRYPILRMGNVTAAGKIDMNDLKYIDLCERDTAKYLVRDGDLLFNRTNSADLVGKTAVFRGFGDVAFAGYLVRLRVAQPHVPEYLSAFLNSAYGKAVLRGMAKSIVGMANINAKEVQTIQLGVPSAERQREFARRVGDVALQREKLVSAAGTLDAMFVSLQQRAFAGEL